jgi:hypothetical protein
MNESVKRLCPFIEHGLGRLRLAELSQLIRCFKVDRDWRRLQAFRVAICSSVQLLVIQNLSERMLGAGNYFFM